MAGPSAVGCDRCHGRFGCDHACEGLFDRRPQKDLVMVVLITANIDAAGVDGEHLIISFDEKFEITP